MSRHIKPGEPAVRLELRWLPARKVWTIVGTRGTCVVHDEAKSTVSIDRTDIVRLVGMIRDELEVWLPFFPNEEPSVQDHVCEESGCQADTPWSV